MTDKERIEELVKPKNCVSCICCDNDMWCKLLKRHIYYEANGCIVEDCPLKTLKDIQNQKAVEALERAKARIDKYTSVEDCKTIIDQVIKEYGGKDASAN